MSADTGKTLVLASASPRRRALLAQVGVPVLQQPVSLDETPLPGEAAAVCAQRLARAKAETLWKTLPASVHALSVVLGADTIVVHDGRVLGKPAGAAEAVAVLLSLSGAWHEVFTAVSILSGQGEDTFVVRTRVKMRAITREEAEAYWRTGEPADKAGGYAVQGLGAVFVEAIEGSYSSVVGLPLVETTQCLARHGIGVWQGHAHEH